MSHVYLAFFNVFLTFLKLLFAPFYIRAINQLHGCECDCSQDGEIDTAVHWTDKT